MPGKSPPKKKLRVKPSRVVENKLEEALQQADRHSAASEWRQAHGILEDLYRRYPDDPEVLSRLLNTSYETGDYERYQEMSESLLTLLPEDAELALALAGAYMLNSRPALARKTFRAYLEKWPQGEPVAEVRESVAEIEDYLRHNAQENHLDFERELLLMEKHERMQSLHFQGRNRQAIRLGEEIRGEFPAYIPVYNNLSQLYWLLDQREKAVEQAEAALKIDETNLHAQANLVIYQLLTGEVERAHQGVSALQVNSSIPLAHLHRVIEALSYLGEDQRVLEAFELARQREDFAQLGQGMAVLYHLAAAAYLRQGNESAARQNWELALELSPGYEHALENLDDLQKPAHLRHAPWSFRIGQWLPEKPVRELLASLDPSIRSRDEARMKGAVSGFLQKNPAVTKLASYMLRLGDESTRDFILLLGRYTEDRRLLEALQEFAQGNCGPDPARLEAAHILVHSGHLESGMQRLWLNGKWVDILLTDIRIVEQPTQQHSETVNTLLGQAIELLAVGDAVTAEELLHLAAAAEPEIPDIQYNLAAALQLQGKSAEAQALVEHVHRQYPEYFFGRTGMAQLLIEKEQFPAARQALQPLFRQRSMSRAELDAFCGVNIDLQLGMQDLPAARAWFGFWESADPNNHKLEVYRCKIGTSGEKSEEE